MDVYKYIIFENKNFIVLNKPYSIPVHSGSKNFLNLIDSFRNVFSYVELCHRIDLFTSGCLLLAKNVRFLRGIQNLFKNNCVRKEYHALVKGFMPIYYVSSLKHNILNNYNLKVKNNFYLSKNSYFNLKFFKKSSLIKILPSSGKLHQIRIHLSFLGFPIANDLKYGSKKFNNYCNNFGLDRMFLHAYFIKFRCPLDNKIYCFKSDYDLKLLEILNRI